MTRRCFMFSDSTLYGFEFRKSLDHHIGAANFVVNISGSSDNGEFAGDSFDQK
jgi:hypothetical protein